MDDMQRSAKERFRELEVARHGKKAKTSRGYALVALSQQASPPARGVSVAPRPLVHHTPAAMPSRPPHASATPVTPLAAAAHTSPPPAGAAASAQPFRISQPPPRILNTYTRKHHRVAAPASGASPPAGYAASPRPPPRGPLPLSPSAFFGTPAAGTGLVNLGNTCYANAVLQLLASLAPFCSDVASGALGTALFAGALPHDGVLAALRDALGELRARNVGGVAASASPYTPAAAAAAPMSRGPARVLAAAEAAGGARFRRGAQQDAHEFLLHLLERGAAEAARAHAAPNGLLPRGAPPLRRTRCPVRRSFTAVLAVTLTCESCGAATTSRELCRALPLDVPPGAGSPSAPPLDVTALLEAAFAPERGVERACAACGGATATLRRALQRPPRVLLLQLKRFRAAPGASPSGGIAFTKCTRRVAAPPRLSLAPHVGGAGAPRPPPPLGEPAAAPPPRPAAVPPPAAAVPIDIEEESGDSDAAAALAAAGDAAGGRGATQGSGAADSGGSGGAAACGRGALRADAEWPHRAARADAADAPERLSDSSDSEASPRRSCENVSLSYRLRAVVSHVGASAAAGHYTTDALDEARGWRRHDDARVSPVSEADVFGPAAQESAYMLVYEHEPAPRAQPGLHAPLQGQQQRE